MYVAAKFVTRGNATHRGDDPVADYESANVATLALSNKFLDQHILLRKLHRLDNCLGNFNRFSENDTDALGAFEEFDDNGSATDSFNRRQHVLSIANESRFRNTDIVATENLGRSKFVP